MVGGLLKNPLGSGKNGQKNPLGGASGLLKKGPH